MAILFTPYYQAEDANGLPMSGALLYFYTAGTTTPVTTYQDVNGATPHANPVVASSSGLFAPIYLAAGSYKTVLKTSAGVTVQTVDNIIPGDVPAGSIVDADVASNAAIDASKLEYTFPHADAVSRSVLDKFAEWVSVEDFGAVGDGVTDDTAAFNEARASSSGGLIIFIPPGKDYIVTSTVYFNRNYVRFRGLGCGASTVRYNNASGGTMFAGDSGLSTSLVTYTSCALEDFTVLSSGVTTDASIVVDITSLSYSHFNIEAQTKRANGVIYYGQGNNGSSPYFNHIESTGLFGWTDRTQIAIHFDGGLWAGGSSGPNANMIGPITRAASLSKIVKLKVGLQNMFSQINGESIKDTYFEFGGNAAVASGTSTGSNTQNTIKKTGSGWSVNAFVNGAVRINSGTGAGQIRRIGSNTSDTITLVESWAVHPDATSVFEVFALRVSGNKLSQIRGEGLSTDNPDFIEAFPDSDHTEVAQHDVSSLGTGALVIDRTGSVRQAMFGGQKVLITHNFVNPGASANTDAWSRTSVLGGQSIAGDYVVEWMKVNPQNGSGGDSCTVTLDCGGTAVGNGSPSIAVTVPNGSSTGLGMPTAAAKVATSGASSNLFLNLTTGASFSATVDVTVTICLTLLP